MNNVKNDIEITATISTKDRYFTTLLLAINSVIQQTYKPKRLIIFDDGMHEDLRKYSVYSHLFHLLDIKKIEWEVVFGAGKGQVLNHQKALEMAKTNWIWRLDDDEVAESNVLEELVSIVASDVGAVGGLVLDPSANLKVSVLASNKIEDIYLGLNVQWFVRDTILEVDHLYSSFLFRREAAKLGYCLDLSPAGHREETLLTYQMKRDGWKLLVNPKAITWHLREKQGGIRSYSDKSMWERDEEIFKRKLQQWNVRLREIKLIVLNCGLGDHICFSNLIDELKERFKDKRIVLAVCYPEVFEDSGVELISIEEAKLVVGDNIDDYNVYKKAWDWGCKDSFINVYRKMYL